MHAYLPDAVRTPSGRHRGGLARIRTDDLAATLYHTQVSWRMINPATAAVLSGRV